MILELNSFVQTLFLELLGWHPWGCTLYFKDLWRHFQRQTDSTNSLRVHLSCIRVHLAFLSFVIVCWFAWGGGLLFCFCFGDCLSPGSPGILDALASVSQVLGLQVSKTISTSVMCSLNPYQKQMSFACLWYIRGIGTRRVLSNFQKEIESET